MPLPDNYPVVGKDAFRTGTGVHAAAIIKARARGEDWLADRVYSVERIRELATRAREVLDAYRVSNVAILVGDGTIGWSRYAPYDAILVAAGGPEIPQPLMDQLADGGRMLIPVGSRTMQRLMLVERTGDTFQQREVTECTFVPLLGRFGWSGEAS